MDRILIANYARAQQLALTIHCPHCLERFRQSDLSINNSGSRYHLECFTRMLVGSAKHQLRECSCYGFPGDEEPGETKRIWARRAAAMFRLLRDVDARARQILRDVEAEAAAAEMLATADQRPASDTAFMA